MSTTVESALHDGSSVLKQAVLSKYAQGEITLSEAATALNQIQPQAEQIPTWRKLVGVLAGLIVVFLVPPWAQRRND